MSRHQAQPSHCRQCRDVNMMSRPPALSSMSRHQHDVATSTPTCCYSARSRRPFPCRDLLCCYPRRDLKMMSRHQAASQGLQPCRHSSQVVMSISGRDLTPNQSRSRPHIDVATSTGPNLQRNFPFFFFPPVASLLLLGPSSPYKTCYPLDDAVA